MTAAVVQWCDPPQTPRWPHRWSVRLAPLLERPGEWAHVERCRTSVKASEKAAQLRRAALGAVRHDGRKRGAPTLVLPPGRWEFEWGPTGDDAWPYGVWARWLGEEGSEAAVAASGRGGGLAAVAPSAPGAASTAAELRSDDGVARRDVPPHPADGLTPSPRGASAAASPPSVHT